MRHFEDISRNLISRLGAKIAKICDSENYALKVFRESFFSRITYIRFQAETRKFPHLKYSNTSSYSGIVYINRHISEKDCGLLPLAKNYGRKNCESGQNSQSFVPQEFLPH